MLSLKYLRRFIVHTKFAYENYECLKYLRKLILELQMLKNAYKSYAKIDKCFLNSNLYYLKSLIDFSELFKLSHNLTVR